MGGIPSPLSVVTVLLVSQREEDHTSLRNILRRSNWNLLECWRRADALELLKRQSVPVALCSETLPEGPWTTLLEETSRLECPPRLIVAARLADERLWAEVLNLGGYDLLMTPFVPEEVFRVVFLAWHSWKIAWDKLAGKTGNNRPPEVHPNGVHETRDPLRGWPRALLNANRP